LQKRIMGRWNKRRRVTWRWILLQPEAPGTLEAKLKAVWIGMKRKLRQGDAEPVWEDSVRQSIAPVSIGGRAPYSRTVMMLAVEQVQQGRHPHEAGGVLEITEEIRERVRRKEIDELTNNHLVRHRIKMLLRLMDDMVKNYAGGDSARVDQCVIEVARDLLEFSGKNNQEITQALGFKLKNFKDVSKKLSSDLVGTSIPVVAGLIRKARIADDLNWVCPYTGVAYDARTLACGNVDKDHIIPRSLCPTDSLDSLVVTFDAVNKWKANRTAWRFVEEEQGKQVPGRPDLSILSLRQFAAFVDKLAAEKKPGRFTPGPGSLDDKLRRWRRKQRLLIKDYEERDLSQRDIEVTSHVVRLCKQQLEKRLPHLRETGRIRALPACVTSTVRKSWNCFSCLIPVCPEVAINLPLVNEQGRFDLIGKEGRVLSMQLRPRAEIRRITHLYQALEACIAAYATILLPDAGKLWEQLVIRKIRPNERAEFEQLHGWNKMLKLISSSRVPGGTATMKLFVDQLPDKFKKQITARLRERRVIHHVPADMSGARLEMNTWRIVETDGDQVTLTQRSCNKLDIDPETGARKRTRKEAKMKSRRIVGLKKGKLSALKAALVIAENYGVALEPRITVVTFHQVKKQLDALREFNGGRPVRVIRNGMLIRVASGTRKGTWRVISVKSTEAYGVALNLATPDGVQLAKGNAPIASLIENGLEILNLSFCGY
jgi:CRISPR-associated endonuclease Csn1